jgi:hypothetical protein
MPIAIRFLKDQLLTFLRSPRNRNGYPELGIHFVLLKADKVGKDE